MDFSFSNATDLKTSSSTLIKFSASFDFNHECIESPDGGLCAQLDHPEKVDEDGVRKLINTFDGMDLTAISFPHPNGNRTHCGTGCWLEFNNATIPAGKSLHFVYRFFRSGSSLNGHNAIALILTYPDGDTSKTPSEKFLICDNAHLKNAADSEWQQKSLTINGANDFQGTVRWVMATGHLIGRNGRPDDRRFAFPGSLFIGNIEVR